MSPVTIPVLINRVENGKRKKLFWDPLLTYRGIEPKPDSMNSLQDDSRIRFEVFAKLGHKYIHAPAQEIIVFPPYIQQHFFPFEDTVGVFTQEF